MSLREKISDAFKTGANDWFNRIDADVFEHISQYKNFNCIVMDRACFEIFGNVKDFNGESPTKIEGLHKTFFGHRVVFVDFKCFELGMI